MDPDMSQTIGEFIASIDDESLSEVSALITQFVCDDKKWNLENTRLRKRIQELNRELDRSRVMNQNRNLKHMNSRLVNKVQRLEKELRWAQRPECLDCELFVNRDDQLDIREKQLRQQERKWHQRCRKTKKQKCKFIRNSMRNEKMHVWEE